MRCPACGRLTPGQRLRASRSADGALLDRVLALRPELTLAALARSLGVSAAYCSTARGSRGVLSPRVRAALLALVAESESKAEES